jgi:hypothetical protein
MPLLDHFRAPVHPRYPWESFPSIWCTTIVERLNTLLPDRYLAAAHVHLGSRVEADVAEFDLGRTAGIQGNGGGVALATWAPPAASAVLPATFPDDIEVQILDTRDDATLAAVVELVSPGNKDRDDTREAFVAKCLAYLQRGVGVIIVDVITTRTANLHNLLVQRLRQAQAGTMPDCDLYATAYRPLRRQGQNCFEVWWRTLAVNQALPELPLALRGDGCVPLDLEATYTRARQVSRL